MAMVGSTLLSRDYGVNNLNVFNIKDDAYVRNASSGTAYASSLGGQYRYTAFYGRLSYVFADKYLLNTTLRTDGSSRFGPNRRFENFGAVGAGWIFSEESWVKSNIPILSFGKLRGSWGVTGNDQIGDYRYLDTYTFRNTLGTVTPTYQGIRPLTVTGLYNPDYGWERTIKQEVGLEMGFFKDRILLTTSFFENKSDNQLLTNALPSYVGFPFVIGNVQANLKTVGQEYTFTSQNFAGKNFTWTTSLNLSVIRNRITSFDSEAGNFENNSFIELLAKKGKSISSVALHEYRGIDSETGKYLFSDREGNPVTADSFLANELASILDPYPRFFGGITNSIRYKNFQLDVSLQFVNQKGKNSILGPNSLSMPGTMYNQDRSVLNRWRATGDQPSMRKFSQDFNNGFEHLDYDYYLASDANYSDASFVRCNNMSLSLEFAKIFKRTYEDN